jgi:hypothetical protein
MNALPTEIQETITSFLTIQEFHKYRFCNKNLILPFVPILTFQAYRESDVVYENASQSIMKLNLKYLNFERFLYLVEKDHAAEFRRCIQSHVCKNLAPQFQQEAFRIALYPIFKPNIVFVLIKYGNVDPSAFSNSALKLASKNGYVELVDTLLKDSSIDPSFSSNLAIRLACGNGHFEVVQLLLKCPVVDPGVGDQESIFIAAGKGFDDVVELLLSHPLVDPSIRYQNPLRYSCHEGHVKVVKALLKDPRVDPTVLEYATIRLSCKQGHVDVVLELLQDSRIDQTRYTFKLLHCAKFCNHKQLLNRLLFYIPFYFETRNGPLDALSVLYQESFILDFFDFYETTDQETKEMFVQECFKLFSLISNPSLIA